MGVLQIHLVLPRFRRGGRVNDPRFGLICYSLSRPLDLHSPSLNPATDQSGTQMDLAEFDEMLMTTRSVRRNLDFDRPVELSIIHQCIDVAVQAPTGMDAENWRFLLVTDPVKKHQIGELYRKSLDEMITARGLPIKSTQRALSESLGRMPVLILVCAIGKPDREQIASQVAFFSSVLPAAWSLMVALRARGLGSTWTTLLSRESASLRPLFDIPEEVTLTVMLPVAYTRNAVLKAAPRRGAAEVSFLDSWGAPVKG